MSKASHIRTNKAKTANKNSAITAQKVGMSMGLTPYQTFFEIAEMANGGQAVITLNAMKPVIKEGLTELSYQGITDLAISANIKVWKHYKTDPELAGIYQEIWEMIDGYALNNLKGEALNFYINATD